MSESRRFGLARVFVLLAGVAGAALFYWGPPVAAGDDHDVARELRNRGEVLALTEVLNHPSLSGLRVLEAELEREHGRLVYELELLDPSGRVHKRYFDAATGQPVPRIEDD